MKLSQKIALLIGLLVLGGGGLILLAQRINPLQKADTAYQQQSYGQALPDYQAALKAGRVPDERKAEIEYRVVVALGKMHKWDEALARGLEFVRKYQGTVWEARGLYWLGRVYIGAPHSGYIVGQKITRGDNPPKTTADAKPEQTDLTLSDFQAARESLEAAVFLFSARNFPKTTDEEIQLDFDLARMLNNDSRFSAWVNDKKWLPLKSGDWQIDPRAAFSIDWPTAKKARWLYARIRALGKSPTVHTAALAYIAESQFLSRYHSAIGRAAFRWEGEKRIEIPYPYKQFGVDEPLRSLVAQLPQDPLHDQAMAMLGSALMQKQHFAEALPVYRQLIASHPKSKWISDAKSAIQQINLPGMQFTTPQTVKTDQSFEVSLATRNMKSARLSIYAAPLDRLVATSPMRYNPEHQLSGNLDGMNLNSILPFCGKPLRTWNTQIADKGDFRRVQGKLAMTPLPQGAYLLVGESAGITSAHLLMASNLTIVSKGARDKMLYYAADSRTGAALPGVSLLVKVTYWSNSMGGSQRAYFVQGTTDKNGLFFHVPDRAHRSNVSEISMFAFKGKNYAFCSGRYMSDYDDSEGRYASYCTTDRSVYRPQQTVGLRQVVMERTGSGLRPLVGKKLKIVVTDPQGQKVYAVILDSSEFGSVHTQFALPANAPLGIYSISTKFDKKPNDGIESAGVNFRVEEYKKPEFEVTVTPDAERVKLGEKASVTVKSNYYFGGGVPNAKVTYRVHRNGFVQQYRFPRDYDYLYRESNQGDYDTDYRRGKVVLEGTTRTDTKGEAKIVFETKAELANGKPSDQSYTVEADVQDASRRTITGTAAVKATHRDVAIFLDAQQGYARSGEHVKVEVSARSSSDQPIAAQGEAKVFRQSANPSGPETEVWKKSLVTDREGRAFIDWTPDKGGYYRVVFTTHDRDGQATHGETFAWVEGAELAAGQFPPKGVHLSVKERYYEEGQAAKLLITTPSPGGSVLLTRQIGNQLLETQVLKVPGRSLEISVSLAHRDVPNVFFSAVMVSDGRVWESKQEVFVPPAHQLANLEIKTDKAEYLPGERATFRLTAKGKNGQPLRAELAVSVSDAALAYIQKSFVPDIRTYFYGHRRSDYISSESSEHQSLGAWLNYVTKPKSYATHEWSMPDGMGQMADWPGLNQLNDWRFRQYQSDENTLDYYEGRGRFEPGLDTNGVETDSAHAGPKGESGTIAINQATPDEISWKHPASPYQDQKSVVVHVARKMAGMRVSAKYTQGVSAVSVLRTKLLDSAFWTPAAVTNMQGVALIQFTWPDNLTRWRACSVGSTREAQVGTAETNVTTTKPLLVRMETPRYFVEKDEMTLSGIVQNNTKSSAHTKVSLLLDTDCLEAEPQGFHLMGNGGSPRQREEWVDIPTGGEKRVDFHVKVKHSGSVKVRMSAQAERASDAIEQSFPVLVYGVEKFTAQSGVLDKTVEATLPINLPVARKAGTSEVVVHLSPSLAVILLDSLPYLNDYPYGCVEQTMSRFLTSVITARTLEKQGIKLADLQKRMQALEEQASKGRGNLNITNSPYAYPKGKPGTEPQMQIRSASPVYSKRKLDSMTNAGLNRLMEFQNGNGSWGWWKDGDDDPYMTAYVLYGLRIAKDAGYAVSGSRMQRGYEYLRRKFADEADLHLLAWEARALAQNPSMRPLIHAKVAGRMYDRRERLNPFSKALLALALNGVGEKKKAEIVLSNIESTISVDTENGTAHWKEDRSCWWRWYGNSVETNATILQAYLEMRPDSKFAPMIVQWLVNRRKGQHWESTRETALAVYALSDYIRITKELSPDYSVTVALGDKVNRTFRVTKENALLFDNRFVVSDSLLQSGAQQVKITKQGKGACYYTVYTRYFSQEEQIAASGNEIFVTRRYFRLLPETASGDPVNATLDPFRPNPFLMRRYELLTQGITLTGNDDTASGARYQRVALKDGEKVTSGGLLEVELHIESKNDYEYLAFEDIKPAGCEPVELRSGGKSGANAWANMELRDQKVALFLSNLTQGTHELTYRLRAESPGTFHVLPTNGFAMYSPDIRALSESRTLEVKDN